jgi:hypothetical protein
VKEVGTFKVRSRDANRIFSSVTHPTEKGAGRLTFAMGPKQVFPPAMLVFIDVLREEFQSKVKPANNMLPEWALEERDEPPTAIRERMPSFVDDMEIPPMPRMELTLEFELLLAEVTKPTGRSVVAVMHGLTLSTRETHERAQKKHVAFGAPPPKNSERRIQVGHQRTAATHHRACG